MRKKNNLRKMIIVLSLIACSIGLVACSNDAESKNEQALDIGKGGSAVDVVIIEFTDEGKEIMAEKTSKLIGEEINLVVKGNLLYDCKLEEAITDGKWVLTGIDDKEDLYKITEELNSVIN